MIAVGTMLLYMLFALPVQAKVQARGKFAIGNEATQSLSVKRQGALKRLERESWGPVVVTVDRATGAVAHLSLDIPSLPGASRSDAALDFVNRYQTLIDTRINPTEYKVSESEACSDTVLLDRMVAGQRVDGSQLVVRFTQSGAIRKVENYVASVPAQISYGSKSIPGLARTPIPSAPNPGAPILQFGKSVLLPISGTSGSYLQTARVLNDPVDKRWARAVTDRTGRVAALVHFDPVLRATSTQAQPLHHIDPVTGIPDFITYRPIGGVKVRKLGAETNPAESVYRFLAAHPAVFRTGAPRCQFELASIRETPALPGVQFVRMQQVYAGLPVFGAELSFEVHDIDKIFSVAGHTLSEIFVPVVPRISSVSAVGIAREMYRSVLANRGLDATVLTVSMERLRPQAQLGVFPGPIATQGKLDARLAWRVDLGPMVYFIDALTGRDLYTHSTVMQAFVVNDAAGLADWQRPSFTTVNINGVAVATPVASNTDALPVAATLPHLEATLAAAGWLGVDGVGLTPFVANTSVALSGGCTPPGLNASNLHESFFCLGRAQPDVVGHEFTHGVTLHSSRLVYKNESGALSEAYADVIGNLIFPDGATPPFRVGIQPGAAWLVGEAVPGFGIAGALRDMANPANFGDPANMGGFVVPVSCASDPFGPACDSGGVHTNSGIVNRAHALLAPAPNGGITRPRLFTLAFTVLTQRLTPWARLVDSALATHEVCESMRIRGGLAIDGSRFGFAECDQVPVAFHAVGLSTNLVSGWAEPELGFAGTDHNFTNGETTASTCPLVNVLARMDAPNGSLQSDLALGLAAGLGSGTSASFFGLFGVTVLGAPNPIGTAAKAHDVNWFNVFGKRPRYYSVFNDGGVNCGPGTLVERTSASTKQTGTLGGSAGNKGDLSIGPNQSAMDARCVLTQTAVELVDSEAADASVVASPNAEGDAKRKDGKIGPDLRLRDPGGNPRGPDPRVDAEEGARLTITPAGLRVDGSWDLSATVHWWADSGDVFFRLRYWINQPAGVLCLP